MDLLEMWKLAADKIRFIMKCRVKNKTLKYTIFR